MRQFPATVALFAAVWTLTAAASPAAGQPPRAAGPDGVCSASSPAEWPGLDGGPRWNGWGAGVTNARYQPADQAGLAAEDVPRLRLKWAFGYPRSATAQSQPTVVGGRLFVASERGVVYALDAATGCTHWTFEAASGVRSAMTVTRLADGRHALFFGDFAANVYALDAATGAEIWRRDVVDRPAPGLDAVDRLVLAVGAELPEDRTPRSAAGPATCCSPSASIDRRWRGSRLGRRLRARCAGGGLEPGVEGRGLPEGWLGAQRNRR